MLQVDTAAAGSWQSPAVATEKTPTTSTTPVPAHVIEAERKEAGVMTTDVKYSAGPYESEEELSFVQRHFYRLPKTAAESDEDGQTPQTRRFSWMSRGSIICMALLFFMVVIVILCAVLATVYAHQRNKAATTFRNTAVKQVILENFPDPAILEYEGVWYAFATNDAAGILNAPANHSSYPFGYSNVQVATSTNYSTWTLLNSTHDPLPKLGAWVTQNMTATSPSVPMANVWAPEILQRPGDSKWVLYYTARVSNATRSHCVGAAVSDKGPTGPYTPLDDAITCPTKEGGAIDPAPFIDVDGSIYLAWKVDGNNVGNGGSCGNTVQPIVDTPIRLQKMQADGVTRDGDAITILNREDSDGPLVEAPAFLRSDDGIYFLFFSSGCTREPSYNVKYAWAHNITGPYTRAQSPLLQTSDYGLLSPGSVGIKRSTTGEIEMGFHARVDSYYGQVRALYTTHLQINGTTVTIKPATLKKKSSS